MKLLSHKVWSRKEDHPQKTFFSSNHFTDKGIEGERGNMAHHRYVTYSISGGSEVPGSLIYPTE